jgi:hypothetical protein
MFVGDAKLSWDRFLATIVNNLNDRVIKIHDYTPSQLLLRRIPVRTCWDITVRQERSRISLTPYRLNFPGAACHPAMEVNTQLEQYSR